MNSRIFTLSLLGFAIANAYAEELTSETVNVTAKGYAAQNLEVPMSTIGLTQEEITHKGAMNVGDALRGMPGVAVSQDSAHGQNPYIRGLGKERIVVMADGIRLNSAEPNGALASFITLGLAEQLEVVKGASSVLYGTGAVGGVINVLMPQAVFDQPNRARASLMFDSSSTGGKGALVSQMSSGDHAFMFGASYTNMGDFRSGAGKENKTGYDSRAFIGQYRYRLNAQHQVHASIQWQEDNDIWYVGSKRPHQSNRQTRYTMMRSPEHARRLFEAGYSFKGQGENPLNVDVRLYRQAIDRDMYNFANWVNGDIVQNSVSFATNGVDAKAQWLWNENNLLSFGVNAWQMKASPDAKQASNAGAVSNAAQLRYQSNLPFKNGEITSTGFFVQNDSTFGALNLLAGLRYDKVKGDADGMNNGKQTTGLKRTDNALSGNLGVIYEVSALFRPYAQYARAFHAPLLRERYQSGVRNDGYYYAGSPDIKPETANQFEVGAKGQNEWVNYDVAFFYQNISNYISGKILTGQEATKACSAQNAAACKKNVNVGKAIIYGIDALADWQFANQQWLFARLSAIRGENKELNEPLFEIPADEVTLGWRGALAQKVSADFALRLVRAQNRVATKFTSGNEDKTPGFATFDLGATWRYSKDGNLRLQVNNLLDKTYHEHLAEGLPGYELNAKGRSFQLIWMGSF